MILLLLIWLFFLYVPSVHKKVLCVAYLTDVNRSGQDVWRHVTYKWYPIRLWDKVKFHSCIKTILHFGEKSSQWRYLKYYYMYCNKCLFFMIWFSAIHFQLAGCWIGYSNHQVVRGFEEWGLCLCFLDLQSVSESHVCRLAWLASRTLQGLALNWHRLLRRLSEGFGGPMCHLWSLLI